MEEGTVICLHSEEINASTHIGKCRLCGQSRRYDPDDPRGVTLIKRGRIDGALTMVVPPSRQDEETPPAEVVKPEQTQTPAAEVKKPRSRALGKKRIAREANKDKIIADYHSMPLRRFLAEHHMCPTTWGRLKTDWGVPPKAWRTRVKHSTPQLPSFNEKWPPSVQVEWLKTYKELALAGKIETSVPT